MAKKRVHEIAKERGMPSKEVIATLQKAGLDVKTAAQSVDENDIEMAFSNGSKQAQPKERPAQRQPQSQGGPRPLGQNPIPQQQQQQPQAQQQQRPPQQQQQQQQQQRPSGGDRPQRPTRGVPPGRDGGGAGGRRRRVVIDS